MPVVVLSVEPVVVVADEVVPVVDVVDGPVNRQETPNRLDKETHSHCVDKAFSALRRTTHCLKFRRLPILLTDSCSTVTLSKHCLLLADPLCPLPRSGSKGKQKQQQPQQQLKFPVHFSSTFTISQSHISLLRNNTTPVDIISNAPLRLPTSL